MLLLRCGRKTEKGLKNKSQDLLGPARHLIECISRGDTFAMPLVFAEDVPKTKDKDKKIQRSIKRNRIFNFDTKQALFLSEIDGASFSFFCSEGGG
jgi:hypothetical protein